MPAVNTKASIKREPLFKSLVGVESKAAGGDSSFSHNISSRSRAMYDKLFSLRPSSNRVQKSSQKHRVNEIERSTNLQQREQYRQLIAQYCKPLPAKTEKSIYFNSKQDGANESKHNPTIVISETPSVKVSMKKTVVDNVGAPNFEGFFHEISKENSTSTTAAVQPRSTLNSTIKDANDKENSPGFNPNHTNTPTSSRNDASSFSQLHTPTNKFQQSPNWFSPPSPYLCRNYIGDLVSTYGRRARERNRKIREEETRYLLLKEKERMKNELLSEMLEEKLRVQIEPDVELIPELTEEMEKIVDDALTPYPQHQVLCEKFNISITRQHIATLAGFNWLNDEVINFYMELIVDRSKTKSDLPSSHAMNTFFYPKLSTQGYKSVRRWTKRVDIFSKDLIFFPIHLGVHWTLAVADFRSKEISYLDSMGGSNPSCLDSIRNYLVSECQDKKKTTLDVSGWKLLNKSDDEIPQQLNGSDCGVFTCTFAEFISRNVSLTFDQSDMPLIRRTMVWEIVNASLTR